MYPSITINKDSKFFVAMCKDDTVHSFISLGVEIGNQKVLLGSFGKVKTRGASNCCFFFGETTGKIHNERIFFKPENEEKRTPKKEVNHKKKAPKILKIRSEMTYKAYTLNWQQFLEFLEYIKLLSLTQELAPLEAYCPTNQTETETEVTLEWQSVETCELINPVTDHSENFDEHKRIGFYNTCRHSAISLTKRASHLTDLGQGISSIFLKSAPLKTSVLGGVMGAKGEHIYILPLPPSSFPGLCDKKIAIITRLYERLDTILLCEQNKKVTVNKFEKIKSLYESITSNEKSSLSEVFNEINNWVDGNKELISTHRNSHWISFPTATEKMFEKLLKENAAYKESPLPNQPTLSPSLLG